MLKKLALLLLLASSVVSAQNTTTLDPGQVYSTPNLVNWGPPTSNGSGVSPWINGVYQQSLTCWGPGGPGNCGPTPTVIPNAGTINFSYGMTDIHQIATIASVLPKSGTGLNVNGYNFAFMAKNGNGWDNGQTDYLSAYVKFYDNKGSAVVDNQYNLTYPFGWSYFNFNKTFDTPYASKDLSTVQYGFVGMDSNYWAGTYGPEIYNISFNLKYSVDPCATNPMFSPTCPGYMDALAKLLPPTTTTDSVTTTATSPTTTVTVTADPVAPTVTVTSTPSQPTATASSTSTSTSSTTSTASSAPSATKEGESQNSSSSGTSIGLSVISKNKEREQAIVTQVVQTATSTAASAAANSQQEAMAVATQASSNSTTFAAATNTSMSSGTGIKMSGSSSSMSLPGQNPDVMPNSNAQQSQIAVMSGASFTSSAADTKLTYSPVATQSQMSAWSATVDTPALGPTDFLTNRTNPLTEIIEAKPVVPQTNTASMMDSSVNRNAADNEAAGGVDLTKMAVAPAGYNAYLNLTLRDVAFYAPKEVYPNQRTVDNARALRLLTNDARHKELVDLQYKGN